MNEETVTITIKGVKHFFNGDPLTSPMQEAIMWLMALEKEEREF